MAGINIDFLIEIGLAIFGDRIGIFAWVIVLPAGEGILGGCLMFMVAGGRGGRGLDPFRDGRAFLWDNAVFVLVGGSAARAAAWLHV